jgi:hypothetical protein
MLVTCPKYTIVLGQKGGLLGSLASRMLDSMASGMIDECEWKRKTNKVISKLCGE